MNGRRVWTRGWRGGVLILAGVLMGAILIQPAVAHVTKKVAHLVKHLNTVYVNEGQSAGGSLSGSYPNPTIGANAVGSAQIADNAVTNAKLADNAVTTAEIAADTITAADIATDGVGAAEIAADAVGASEVKGIYSVVTGTPAPTPNTFVDATATCNSGDAVLGGGFAWQNDGTISTVGSTQDPLANPNQWVVRSRNSVASTLFAWAVCLTA